MYSEGSKLRGLKLEIWDKRTLVNKFLGQVTVKFNYEQLCADGQMEGTFLLNPRKKSEPVQGSITFSVKQDPPVVAKAPAVEPAKVPEPEPPAKIPDAVVEPIAPGEEFDHGKVEKVVPEGFYFLLSIFLPTVRQISACKGYA